jgi:hypothetical protein
VKEEVLGAVSNEPNERTFEIVARLLELRNLGVVERQSIAQPSKIIRKVRPSPSCWRYY